MSTPRPALDHPRTIPELGRHAPGHRLSRRPRVYRLTVLAILIISACVAVVWALTFGGGAAPLQLADAGPLARWGLPVAKLVVNVSAAGMGGLLFVALFALRAEDRGFELSLDVAAVSATVFTLASAAAGFFSFLIIFNPALDAGPEFGSQLGRYLVQTEGGRVWLFTTIAGAILAVLSFAVRSWGGTATVAALALVTLMPMGTQGHSGDEASHQQATTAVILHILAAAVWLGGLMLIAMVRPVTSERDLTTVLSRYSTVAVVAFAVVAFSGIVRAAIGLETFEALASSYGTLLIIKVLALTAMGVLGAVHRLRLIRGMHKHPGRSRFFWTLFAVELALMGVASGVAAALARTPPPIAPELPDTPTPAEILTGAPVPPAWSSARWFTAWNVDLLWIVVVILAAVIYAGVVLRLRAEGGRWSRWRTAAWMTGLLLLMWVTSGAVGTYRSYLYSAQALTVVVLVVGVVPLLAAGSPIQLARRAARRREDGSRGEFEWARVLAYSYVARVASTPFIAVPAATATLWLLLHTELIRWSAGDLVGRQASTVGILVTGFFVVRALTNEGASVRTRLLLLVGAVGVMAFLSVWTMSTTGLIAADWFGAMGRTWGLTPSEDQKVGGLVLAGGSAIALVVGAGTLLRTRAQQPRRS